MSFPSHRGLRSASLLLSVAFLVAATPLAAQASVKDPTVTSVIKAVKADMLKQTGVHVVVNSKSGKVKSQVVVDIGMTNGKESIAVGNETVLILITPKYAYLSGSKTGLTTIMGLSATQQKKVGSDAITMKAGTAPYTNLKSSLTILALAAILPTVKGTSLQGSGASNYQLSWTTKATTSAAKSTSVLTISSDSKTLPITETIVSTSGSDTTTFSNWGEQVSVTTPATSSQIAYAKVLG